MSVTSRMVLRIAATAALLLTGTSCTGSTGTTASPAPTGSTSITVGNGPFLSNADLYLTERKGYFGEVGLKTTVTFLTAGSNAVPQLLNNGLQFAAVDVPTAVAAVAQHLPIEVVAPNTVGSSGDRGFAGVLVSPKSGVTTPAGLAGKTVAVNQINGTAMILTRASLAKAGADWKQVKFTEVEPPSLLTTLVSGRADAAALGEPGVTAAESQRMTYLFNPERDTIPGIAAFVYIASTAYARAHPEVVRSFQSALLKGHVYANAHPDEVRATAKTSTQVPPALLAKAVLPVFGEKAVESREIATWIALQEQYGGFDPAKAPSPAAVLGQ